MKISKNSKVSCTRDIWNFRGDFDMVLKTNNQLNSIRKALKFWQLFKDKIYYIFWKILKDKNIQQLQSFMYREIYGILEDADVVFLGDEWWFAECCSDQQLSISNLFWYGFQFEFFFPNLINVLETMIFRKYLKYAKYNIIRLI